VTPTKLTKTAKTYGADDGAKRGPLTVANLRFHPAGRHLVACCGDRRVAVWDLDAAEVKVRNVSSVPGALTAAHEAGWVRCADFSPDGAWLATGGSDRRLKLWAWAGGKPAATAARDVPAHEGWVEGLAFAPDGKRLVTVGADRRVRVWDEKLAPVATLDGHTGILRDVAWVPDGSAFVSGGEDGKLIVWDAKTLARVRVIEFGDANDQFGQNPALSGAHRLHASRNGKWLAAAGNKRTAVFDLATGAAVAAEPAADLQAAFSPAADVLAAGSNTVRVWAYDASKWAAGKSAKPGPVPGKELGQVKLGDFALGVRFSADGKLLGLGKSNGTVEVWEVA
jgi:WD40 repeat protein